MAGSLDVKLALARGLGKLSRLRGGGATTAPGQLLMRLDRGALGKLAARLPEGNVMISATNGKTTTAAMLASIMAETGVVPVHNQAGANMASGIASTLLDAARGGRIAGDFGLFEVDEFWLDRLVLELHPRALLLINLFRDQLDRYGELDTIAERWEQAIKSGPAADSRLVLNADDPLIADLGRSPRKSETLYFGVQDSSLALAGMAHAADAKHCRNCGTPYVFDIVLLGHLGHYHCPNCGQSRPTPTITATNVVLEGVRTASFTLHTPAGAGEVKLRLPGLYNVYNALAAAALASALEVPLASILAGLQATEAAFGRAETITLDRGEMRILLIKNPAGANEVLRTLALEPGEHDLFGILNDKIADGRDVSWIWDADFELLASRVRRVTCSGTRAAELAVRLKYAGVDPERIHVQSDLQRALSDAIAAQPESSARTLYALPTYTAMLALRELLVARGEARSAWS
jgi:UDP-N-acetylmuramyl tripeptide synthase